MARGKIALISAFLVGGGQIYSGRFWTGLSFAIIFYGSIFIMRNIWTGLNNGFWGLIGAWVLVWLFNIYDAYKGFGYEKPPCERACPANIAPWIYINLIASDSKEKYPFIPFFKILEMICPAPCEEQCTRRGIDAPVAIKYLKSGVETVFSTLKEKTKKKRVAVVGAGPCGLTAAYFLANKSYEVVVYEKGEKAGGVLAALIPEFRLPGSVLAQELEAVLDVGFELKCGIEIGQDISVDDLLKNYHAIFVAAGSWQPTKLGIPGEDIALVGFDVLGRIKKGEKFNMGRIAVIGGGNTAIDIGRSLVRQGNEVEVYYRRAVEDMPAEHENLAEAQEEGIEIITCATPIEIKKDRMTMVKTECPDGRAGSFNIIKGSEFDVKIDRVIIGTGQQPDTNFMRNYVALDSLGRIKVKHNTTSHPRIFAGGDVVLGSKTVAHAVGHGINAARAIDLRLRHIPRLSSILLDQPYLPEVKFWAKKDIGRIKIPHRSVAERKHDFKEVELKVSKEALVKEASRCLCCPLRYRP